MGNKAVLIGVLFPRPNRKLKNSAKHQNTCSIDGENAFAGFKSCLPEVDSFPITACHELFDSSFAAAIR